MHKRLLPLLLACCVLVSACGGGGGGGEDGPFSDEILLAAHEHRQSGSVPAVVDTVLLCLGAGLGDDGVALTIGEIVDGHTGPLPIVREADGGVAFTDLAQNLTDGAPTPLNYCVVPSGFAVACATVDDGTDFDVFVTQTGPDLQGYEITGVGFDATEMRLVPGAQTTYVVDGDILVYGRPLP